MPLFTVERLDESSRFVTELSSCTMLKEIEDNLDVLLDDVVVVGAVRSEIDDVA